MSEAYLGEIRMFGGGYAPANWALCNGALVSTSESSALFAVIGTTYGGDGIATFALPDLRGRVAIHQGTGPGLTARPIGQAGGTETVALSIAGMATHRHDLRCSTEAGTLDGPTPVAVPATPTNGVTPFLYVVPGTSPLVPGAMTAGSIGPAGGGGAHANMMPSLCVSFIISLTGIFPVAN